MFMAKMKNSMKCLIAVFVIAMAFVVTGITASAADAETPTDVKQTKDSTSSVTIKWIGVSGASYYGVQVATDAAFNNIVKETRVASTDVEIPSLLPGTTYYVKVGYGDFSNCYKDFSPYIEVVTSPSEVDTIEFVGANDTSAKIQYSPAPGATSYDIIIGDKIYSTTATTYNVPIAIGGDTYARVYPRRTTSDGKYTTKYAYHYNTIYGLSRLTTKISKNSFGISSLGSGSASFKANYYGEGFEIQLTPTAGKKKTITAENAASLVTVKNFTSSMMYKYRVRAYITTTAKKRVYGNWSDYRYFCRPKNVKMRSSGGKIQLTWGKLKGVSKIKVMISTKEDSGFKKVTTLDGNKKSCTITKCGKKALKKYNRYYVRLYYQTKVGKKYKDTDVYFYSSIMVY